MFLANSDGRTCEYNGRIYQNGETFRAGCKHQCSCIDGAVGCAPLCTNKLPPASPSCPYPQLTRIPGQCCFSVDCHKGTWHLPPKYQVCVALVFHDKIILSNGSCTGSHTVVELPLEGKTQENLIINLISHSRHLLHDRCPGLGSSSWKTGWTAATWKSNLVAGRANKDINTYQVRHVGCRKSLTSEI